MRTLIEDMSTPMNDVDRWYIRVPLGIFSSIVMLVVLLFTHILLAFQETWVQWFYPVVFKKPYPPYDSWKL
jgi:hypothetical protein